MKIVFKTLNSADPICFLLPNMSITKVNHCMTYKARHSVKNISSYRNKQQDHNDNKLRGDLKLYCNLPQLPFLHSIY